MNRRSFLTGMAGILAAGSAQWVVQSGILMPVRKVWTPEYSWAGHTITITAEFTEFAGTYYYRFDT